LFTQNISHRQTNQFVFGPLKHFLTCPNVSQNKTDGGMHVWPNQTMFGVAKQKLGYFGA